MITRIERLAMLGLAILAASASAVAPPVRSFTWQAARLESAAGRAARAGQFDEAVRKQSQAVTLLRQHLVEKHFLVQRSRTTLQRLQAFAKLPVEKHQPLAEALRFESQALALLRQNRAAAGEKAARQALTILRRVLGDEHEETAWAYTHLASSLSAQGKHALALPLFDQALALATRLFGEDHPRTTGVLVNKGRALLMDRKPAEALSLFEKALAIRHKQAAEEPDTAATYLLAANCLELQGKVGQAAPYCEKALAIFRQVLGEQDPNTASAHANLGNALRAGGQVTAARRHCEQALAIFRTRLGEQNSYTARAYLAVACCMHEEGKLEQALPAYEKALAIWRTVSGENHPDTARGAHFLAIGLLNRWQAARALSLARQALRIRRRALGEKHPDTARTEGVLAECLFRLGNVEAAILVAEHALKIDREVLGEEHPTTAKDHHSLALYLRGQGKEAMALPLLETALKINRKVLGVENLATARSYMALSHCLAILGKPTRALALGEKALNVRRQLLGEDHPDVADSCANLAQLHELLGGIDKALPWYEKALAIRRKSLGEQDANTARSYYDVGSILQEQGKPKSALPLCEKALKVFRQAMGEEHGRTAQGWNTVGNCLWCLGKQREAVRHWETVAAIQEINRCQQALTGFDRSQLHRRLTPAHARLAAVFARLDRPTAAFRHAEAHLARGLLDDLDSAGKDSRQSDPADEGKSQGEALLQKARRAAEASQRRLLSVADIQEQIPDDGAFLLWLAVADLEGARREGGARWKGDHWACVLRRQGSPVWQRLKASGPKGEWTEQDVTLPARLYRSLNEPDSHAAATLAADYRKRLFEPLLPHLAARDGLPAVRRLFVVPTNEMAFVPVEVFARDYEVSYVPSGSVMARLRRSHRPLRASSLLALGDPVFAATLPEPPEQGVILLAVLPGGNAARAGLRAGDVLLRCGKRRLTALADLKEALEGGPASVQVWRDGKEFAARLDGWPLGASLSRRPARIIRERRGADPLLALPGKDYQPLPGTRWEVAALTALAPGAKSLLGSAASEQELDRLRDAGELKKYRLLHFATHGEASHFLPDESALILARDRLPDPLEQARSGKKVYEGRLTVKTIRRTWRLDADLVVLSACRTALGQDAGGDGMLGFAFAFLSRGARSVVLSRWQVDDAATALLMLRFYENLLGKRKGVKAMGRAEALAEARKWLRSLRRKEAENLVAHLTNGEIRGTIGDAPRKKLVAKAKVPAGERPYEHPFYWAAFVLIGDPD